MKVTVQLINSSEKCSYLKKKKKLKSTCLGNIILGTNDQHNNCGLALANCLVMTHAARKSK